MYNNSILTLGTFSNEFTIYLFVTCTSVTHYTIASQYHKSIFMGLAIKGWPGGYIKIKKYISEYVIMYRT